LAYFYNAAPSRTGLVESLGSAQNALERGRRKPTNETYPVVTSQ